MNHGPIIDERRCDGCNKCIEICDMDIFVPSEKPKDPPIVRRPDECWFGGGCLDVCPRGALKLVLPADREVVLKQIG